MSALDNCSEEKKTELHSPDEKVSIFISSDLHSKAMAVCQRRRCSIELVVEELIYRYLPTSECSEQAKLQEAGGNPGDAFWRKLARRRR